MLYLLLAGIYVVIDSQLVANYRQVLAQQSVVVERPYQIFYYVALLVSQFHLAHLLFQLVVERLCLAIHHLLAILAIRAATLIHRQILVVAAYTVQSLVECTLSFLALCSSLKVLCPIGIASTAKVSLLCGYGVVIIGRFGLKGRVIVHLSIDTVNQLRHWQFYQRRLQQLLLRECLSQFLLL